jgi:tungstate transport system substrate-binding protein
VLLALACAASADAQRFITVASTTSTEQSGLFGHILPLFERETGIEVRVVALGTGQALDLARRGDADVVFVHARSAEEEFVREGHGVRRFPVMYNDFVIIGPRADPAGIAGGTDTLEAFRKIKNARAPFVSRGDRSGTHIAEVSFWTMAGIDIAKDKGAWYRETGQGMGPALNTASSMNAYLLSDRATWLAFMNRGDLGILVEGDTRLMNQYGVMLVSPERHPSVKRADGQAFIDWLISPEGQAAIAAYSIGGEQLFFPNANEPGA